MSTRRFPPPAPNPLNQPKEAPIAPQETQTPRPQTPLRVVEAIPDEKTDPGLPRFPEMGKLTPLFQDPSITEIMVNDTRNIIVEKSGKLLTYKERIESREALSILVQSILESTGRILTPDQPYLDVMLPDGSRVNLITNPLSVTGTIITIRKFPQRLRLSDLAESGTFSSGLEFFLKALVQARCNLLISGGTGAGKTTLLNALMDFIPKTERLVTIEDTPELSISHPNWVRLQVKPQTPSSSAIGTRELLSNALRMRPDRIVVGECRGAEAFDMLQAMNTGHEGSITTLHSNSPRDALSRLETLFLLSGFEIPMLAIRKQVASALDFVIQIKRHRDGTRTITSIKEVTGMEGETFLLQDIFENGQFTGMTPKSLERFESFGIEFPLDFFSTTSIQDTKKAV